MKKSRTEPTKSVEIASYVKKEQIKEKNVLLLDIHIQAPRCQTPAWHGCKRFNRFYREMADRRLHYAKTKLLSAAKKHFRMSKDTDAVFLPFSFQVEFFICYNDNGVLSLYYDVTQNEGGEALRLRYADTWNLHGGYPMPPLLTRRHKKPALSAAAEQCTDDSFFPGIKRLLQRYYRPEQSYLQADGLRLYYPPSSIASGHHGFCEFNPGWPASEILRQHGILPEDE